MSATIRLPEPGYTALNLKTVARTSGLKRKELAQLIDASIKTFNKWCDGATTMPAGKWQALLTALEKKLPHLRFAP